MPERAASGLDEDGVPAGDHAVVHPLELAHAHPADDLALAGEIDDASTTWRYRSVASTSISSVASQ
jgi:hypothetical protein